MEKDGQANRRMNRNDVSSGQLDVDHTDRDVYAKVDAAL